ncbi:MAG: glycosyltransferase [Firmicutes bacterium]|nr:glycosyltransferase [Bacillota bacterium]
MTKVSVIIPCYNAERFMAMCLQSVLNQTLTNIEIICVDDGSTDSTLTILRDFEQKDSRVTVITQQNQYAGVARNAGMAIAKGEYLYFLDSDDFIEPTMLAKMVAKCEEDNADICLCQSVAYDLATGKIVENQNIQKDKIFSQKMPFSSIDAPNFIFVIGGVVPWNKLFRAEFVKQHKIKFQPLKRSNDVFFSSATLALAERITIVDEFLCNRHINLSTSLQGTYEDDSFTFYHAVTAVKNFLIEQNLYNQLEGALTRQAVGTAVHALNKMTSQKNYIEMGNFLKKTHFPKFYVLNKKYYDIYSKYQMKQVMFIMSGLYKNAKNINLKTNEILAQDPSLDFPLNDKLKVSVIIPILADCTTTENIWECINSVLRQSLVDIEIICVVDKNIKVDNQSDKRVKIFEMEKNADYSAAWNFGINKAKGEYIFFLEPNDTLVWRALEHLYRCAKYYKRDIVQCQSAVFFEPVELFYEYNIKNRRSFLVSRDFLQNNQLFVPKTPSVYEVDMLMVAIIASTTKVDILEEPLHRRRISHKTRHIMPKSEQIYYLYLFVAYTRIFIQKKKSQLNTLKKLQKYLESQQNIETTAEESENFAEVDKTIVEVKTETTEIETEEFNELTEISQTIKTLKNFANLYSLWIVEIYQTITPNKIENLPNNRNLTNIDIAPIAKMLEQNNFVQKNLQTGKLNDIKPKKAKKINNPKRLIIACKKYIKERALISPFFYGIAYKVYKITGYKG